MGLLKILTLNSQLELDLAKGVAVTQIMEKWDALHLFVAVYINSETPGLPPTMMPSKPTRGAIRSYHRFHVAARLFNGIGCRFVSAYEGKERPLQGQLVRQAS